MSHSPNPEVTQILESIRLGDSDAIGKLMPLVYDELRSLAESLFRDQRSNHTLQPTALVHDAYLKLMGSQGGEIESRRHFFRVAAKAMRQLLVDYARARRTDKRGGDCRRVELQEDSALEFPELELDIVELDEALTDLAKLDERQAKVVELRLLAGLTVAETAEALGVVERTVYLDWRMARFWLEERLRSE